MKAHSGNGGMAPFILETSVQVNISGLNVPAALRRTNNPDIN